MSFSGGPTTYPRSGKKSVTIANGALTPVAVLDLGANYAFLQLGIQDCQFIPAAALLTLEIGMESGATLYKVYGGNDPETVWSKNVPSTGSIIFHVDGVDLVRWVKPTLSLVTTGAVTFDFWGFDPASN